MPGLARRCCGAPRSTTRFEVMPRWFVDDEPAVNRLRSAGIARSFSPSAGCGRGRARPPAARSKADDPLGLVERRRRGQRPAPAHGAAAARAASWPRRNGALRSSAAMISPALAPPSGMTKTVALRRSGLSRTSVTVMLASRSAGSRHRPSRRICDSAWRNSSPTRRWRWLAAAIPAADLRKRVVGGFLLRTASRAANRRYCLMPLSQCGATARARLLRSRSTRSRRRSGCRR